MSEAMANKQTIIKFALAFIMIGFIMKAFAMLSYGVEYDTNFYLNIASNFMERGELTPYMWRLGADTTIIAGSGTGYGILIPNYWFMIFGLSLMSGYILMYIAGTISLIVLYFLLRDWWQSPVASWVSIAYLTITAFFIRIFYLRMEALAILSYSLLLLLHLYAVRNNKIWLHALLGIATVLAAEVHIFAILYLGSFSLYYLVDHIRHWRQTGKLIALTASVAYYAGALIAGIIYLIIHVLPDPEAYFIIARTCGYCSGPGIVKELIRYFKFILSYPLETLVFATAITLTILRRSSEDKHYLILFIGYILAQAIISPPDSVQYTYHMMPFFPMAVAAAVAGSNNMSNVQKSCRLVVAIAIGSIIVMKNLVFIAVAFAIKTPEADNVRYIHDYVPHDRVIMGKPPYYHHFLDYPLFLSYATGMGVETGLILNNETYETFYAREAPQVFIGELNMAHREFLKYMHEHDFQQVRDELWVSGDLLSELLTDVPEMEIALTIDDEVLAFGECTELTWSVSVGDDILLNDQPVDSEGIREVCPLLDTDYTLEVRWVGGIEIQTVTVQLD